MAEAESAFGGASLGDVLASAKHTAGSKPRQSAGPSGGSRSPLFDSHRELEDAGTPEQSGAESGSRNGGSAHRRAKARQEAESSWGGLSLGDVLASGPRSSRASVEATPPTTETRQSHRRRRVAAEEHAALWGDMSLSEAMSAGRQQLTGEMGASPASNGRRYLRQVETEAPPVSGLGLRQGGDAGDSDEEGGGYEDTRLLAYSRHSRVSTLVD